MEAVGGDNRFALNLVDRQWLASGILELRLTRPPDITFFPGQFMRFEIDGYQRDYTMTSAPDADTLDFCVDIVDKGRFSTEMIKTEIGTTFHLCGPHGHFIYQGAANVPVFVATGTGIAPFVSFFRSGVADGLLIHGVSTPDRLIYRDFLGSAAINYVPCVSRLLETGMDGRETFRGRVTDYLEKQLAPRTYDFYLCGRRTMIRDATALIDDKFSDSRLFIEAYD